MLQHNCFIRCMYFVLCRSLPRCENLRGFFFILLAHAGVSPPGGGGGDSHMKQTGMLVVSLRGINFGFWSRLGCSGQRTNILSC